MYHPWIFKFHQPYTCILDCECPKTANHPDIFSDPIFFCLSPFWKDVYNLQDTCGAKPETPETRTPGTPKPLDLDAYQQHIQVFHQTLDFHQVFSNEIYTVFECIFESTNEIRPSPISCFSRNQLVPFLTKHLQTRKFLAYTVSSTLRLMTRFLPSLFASSLYSSRNC